MRFPQSSPFFPTFWKVLILSYVFLSVFSLYILLLIITRTVARRWAHLWVNILDKLRVFLALWGLSNYKSSMNHSCFTELQCLHWPSPSFTTSVSNSFVYILICCVTCAICLVIREIWQLKLPSKVRRLIAKIRSGPDYSVVLDQV